MPTRSFPVGANSDRAAAEGVMAQDDNTSAPNGTIVEAKQRELPASASAGARWGGHRYSRTSMRMVSIAVLEDPPFLGSRRRERRVSRNRLGSGKVARCISHGLHAAHLQSQEFVAALDYYSTGGQGIQDNPVYDLLALDEQ